jgi:response regulator RpfG family c-di-GMP phosphodiesterase
MNLALKENTLSTIWIIDDDQSMRWVLEKTLVNNGYQVTAFESGSVALASFKRVSRWRKGRTWSSPTCACPASTVSS